MAPFAVAKVDVRGVSRLCKALGDETRLRIVALLSHGELCVCHVESALALSQPTASRHLAVLRAAAVVETRRSGTWMYYRLAPQHGDAERRLLRSVVAGFAGQDLLARDVARLVKARGPNSCR